MTKDEIKAAAGEIYSLASQCRVPILRACRAIGMAPSTLHRWKHNGSMPGDGQMRAIRGSILIIAEKHGTLPDRHRAEMDTYSDDAAEQAKHRPANAIVREIIRSARELEQSLAAEV